LLLLLSLGPIAPDGTLLIEKERLLFLFLLICIGLCADFVAVAVVFIVKLFIVGEVVFGGEN